MILIDFSCGKIDQNMKFQKNLSIHKKNILIRVDLNVPKVNNQISDNSRIAALKQTLEELVINNNKIFLLSHFNRPQGEKNLKFSLRFVIDEMEKTLRLGKIHFIETCIGDKVREKMLQLEYGQICLMENVRFFKEEEINDLNFAKELAKNFDYFINDAFSVCHRKHSSIVGITKFLPSYGGYLLDKELSALKSVLENPKKPTTAIIGGSKVSTKISLLENLARNLDYLIVGGGMANTFLAAKGFELGRSLFEKSFFNKVDMIEKIAHEYGCKIILPTDVVTSLDIDKPNKVKSCLLNNIGQNDIILDIGLDSSKNINKIISDSKTVLWNGPLGVFEKKPFDRSTVEVAKKLSHAAKKYNLTVVAGGGDTIAAIRNLNVMKNFTYISYSGGAFLEWLAGRDLPGITALKESSST